MTDPAPTETGTDTEGGAVFRDAETFLAELGIDRRPIVVRLDDDGHGPVAADAGGGTTLAEAAAPLVGEGVGGDEPPGPERAGPERGGHRHELPGEDTPPVSLAEAARIATETDPPHEIDAALSYVRRSTAAQPASEGRLRSKLAERDHGETVIERAMEQARAERLVDDDALSAALVAEWRAKGYAPRRIRRDLRRRGFDEPIVERAVGRIEDEDQAAVAFTLARRRAETLAHLPPETAFRRVAGYVARRGYGEGLARKAARDAVYDQRHEDRVAGH